MNKLGRKIFSVLFLIILSSLVVNFFRQVLVYRRVNRRLFAEKQELQTLEKKNQELKLRLEEIRKQGVLGESSPTQFPSMIVQEGGVPNYKKWWGLFGLSTPDRNVRFLTR